MTDSSLAPDSFIAPLGHPVFSDLDRALAASVDRLYPEEHLGLACAVASAAVAHGHSCADLRDLARLWQSASVSSESLDTTATAPLTEPLESLPQPTPDHFPVVREGSRLYLRRYHAYETLLAANLGRMVADELAIDPDNVSRCFDGNRDEGQQQAVVTALGRRFSIITGGPGTGKTYTIARLCAAFLNTHGKDVRIALAAPTGKAADQLGQALAQTGLPHAQWPNWPDQASTLHRLLGYRPHRSAFRHDAESPLPADLVVVDEASMADLPLMAKLTSAVSDTAQLCLVGDHHQLPAVEAGNVLADLVSCSALRSCVARLGTAHRFDASLSHAARAAHEGNANDLLTAIQASRKGQAEPGIQMSFQGRETLDAKLAEIAEAFASVADMTPRAALEQAGRWRLLAAGRVDVAQCNRRVTDLVAGHTGFRSSMHWYPGRPVMMNRNDYRLGLFNGDIGICLSGPGGRLDVWFCRSDELVSYPTSVLAALPTCYATTVHKAQGSEFDHVVLLLPEKLEGGMGALVTRELIYTGMTRARMSLDILSSEHVLQAGLAQTVQRWSGLSDRLSETLK